MQCAATTKKGGRCKKVAMAGCDHCRLHIVQGRSHEVAQRITRRWWFAPSMIGSCTALIVALSSIVPVEPDWPVDPPRYQGSAGTISSLELSATRRLELRLQRYERDLESLRTNIEIQALLIVICIALLASKSKDFKIPGMDVSVSRPWVHVIAPLALLYFWLGFGYLLDGLIENRLRLFVMMSAIDGQLVDRTSAPNATLAQYSDPKQLLLDYGWIDAWFSNFFPNYSAINLKEITNTNKVFAAALFGIFFGTSHACIVATVLAGAYRNRSGAAARRTCMVVLFVSYLVLVGSHLQFRFNGKNPNWIQLWVSVGFVLVLFILSRVDARFRGGSSA